MVSYFISLVENCALLFMVVVILDLLELDQLKARRVLCELLIAMLLSCLGLVIMARSYEFAPGIYMDARSILLFAVGLFFGNIPTLVVLACTSIFRLLEGGAGVLPGIVLIFISVLVGRMTYRFYRGRLGQVSFLGLLLASSVVHLFLGYLFITAMLAQGAAWGELLCFLTVILPAFTLGAAALALFMSRRIRSRERREMLAAIGEEQRLLSSAVEQSPSSVVITDVRGHIEYVNPKFTELTGYSSNEALGRHTRIMNSGFLPKSTYAELWETIFAGKVWKGELHNKRKDGSLFWESASIAPFRGEDGEIKKFIAVKEDITERKDLESRLVEKTRKLEESNEVKSKFISMVSHELMTPLNHIIGPTEYILESIKDEDHKEMLKIVHAGGLRLKRIFNDMIFISDKCFSLEAFREEFVAPSAFLESCTRQVETDVGADVIVVRVNEALPNEIKIRPELVCRVIHHFVENSLKFAESEEVELSLEVEPGYLVFHVKDRGPGIPTELKKRIGELFEQLDMTMARRKDGLGLGLAVCKVMADLCGGRIDVENRPDGGSDFSLYYPVD